MLLIPCQPGCLLFLFLAWLPWLEPPVECLWEAVRPNIHSYAWFYSVWCELLCSWRCPLSSSGSPLVVLVLLGIFSWKGVGLLSDASSSVCEITMWFSSFGSVTWCVTLIHFHLLSQPCITRTWYIFLLLLFVLVTEKWSFSCPFWHFHCRIIFFSYWLENDTQVFLFCYSLSNLVIIFGETQFGVLLGCSVSSLEPYYVSY